MTLFARSQITAAAVLMLSVGVTAARANDISWNNAAGGSWIDPGNWNPTSVPGGADHAIIALTGAYDVIATGGLSVGSISITAAQPELWIQGSNAGNHTLLTCATDIDNAGTLRLESIDGAWNSNLTLTSGTLTNTGTIQINLGTGGSRIITGSVANSGAINVGAGAALNLAATGKTFTQNAGSINAPGLFLMDSGAFTFSGGSTSGSVYLRNSQLNVTSGVTTPSTIIATGSPTLINNNSQNVTVWVAGSDLGSHTTMALSAGGVNVGTIRMESLNGAYNTQMNATGNFTNAASGVIHVSLGTGGPRSITGHLTNAGAINVDSDTALIIPNSYTAAGGALNGPAYLVNAALNETASPAQPTTITITGGTPTLTSGNLSNTTVWVQGSNVGGHTTLTSAAGFNNAGTLRLESVDGAYASNLTVTSGTLANSGIIQANAGAGGTRIISGNLTNNGTITAGAGTTLSLPASGKTVMQAAGSINAPGLFLMDDGQFTFAGGLTTGNVYFRNSQITVAGTVTTPSTIIATGLPLLINNASPNVTVWAQGSDIGSHTTMSLSSGATNAGTIRMESINGGYNTLLSAAGNFTNLASGVIHVSPGSGGQRSISGHLTNAGTVNVDPGTLLTIPDAYTAAGGTLNGPAYLLNAVLNETASTAQPTTIMITGGSPTLTSGNFANTTLWLQGSNLGGHSTLTSAVGFTNAGTIRLESIDGGYASNLTLSSGTLLNTNSGAIQVNPGAGGTRAITASISNAGLVNVAQGTFLNIAGNGKVFNQNNGSIKAPGLLIMDDGLFNFNGGSIGDSVYLRNSQLNVSAAVTVPSTIFVTGTPTLINNGSSNVTVWVQGGNIGGHTVVTLPAQAGNAGTIRMESIDGGYQSSLTVSSGPFINSGTIQVNPGAGGFRIITGDVTNNGTIVVAANTELNITGNLTNNTGTTLTGGIYNVSGSLRYNNASITTDSADITLDGPSSAIVNQGSTNALLNLDTISASGKLTLKHGRNFSTDAATLSNAGLLALDRDVTVHAANFTQASTGNLAVQIVGTTAGTTFSNVAAVANVVLDGTLTVRLTGGFAPAINDQFQIVEGASRTGQFSNFDGLEGCGGRAFQVVYGPTDARLVAVASTFTLGDLDHDGLINTADLTIFAQVLTGADIDYLHQVRCDLNCDGLIDGRDIKPFVTAFTH